MLGMDSVTSADPAQDPLNQGPPRPQLRNAKSGSGARVMPKLGKGGNGNDGGTRALSLAGASPAIVLANAMMTIEQQIKAMQQAGYPQLAQIFEQAVESGRDALAAAMANQVQGGSGVVTQDAGAPAPSMAPPQAGGGPPMGGAGGMMGMMPPPPPGQ